MSSLAKVPTCWKTRQHDIYCTSACHSWHQGDTLPRIGGAGLSIPNGSLSLTHGQIARMRTGMEGGLCQFKESALPALCRKCLLAGRLRAVHISHRPGLRHSHTRSGFRTDMTVKSLRQRKRKRFSLNQEQSIFSKCDLSSCLLFCHILEGLLLGLQGGEGIYLHQITFLYTSPH